MALYVDVIVDIAVSQLDKIFQYRASETLASELCIGCQVWVPFGRGNRLVKGFVVGMSDIPAYEEERIKGVDSIDSSALPVEGQLIALAGWMRSRYGSTMAQALKTVLPVRKTVKEVKNVIYVLKDEKSASELLEKSRSSKREKARVRLLEALLREKYLPRETVTGVLRIASPTLKAVLETGVMCEETTRQYREPVGQRMHQWKSKTQLNEEQLAVVRDIWEDGIKNGTKEEWHTQFGVHLLHGITGSGKTEVYMALIEKVLAQGKQVIVLIPEISLTLQTVSRFYEKFGNSMAVLHSKLSAGERYDQYMRADRGEARIMIGPRSALFAPFEKLGMIIIDEEHESSYKSETTPRYDARDVAIARARAAKATVVMGSATPSLESYTRALDGTYRLHRLSHRAKAGSFLPEVEIVDLKEEFQKGNRGILSGSLHQAMEECLRAGEQMMLFINRRGYAGFVSCRSCGHVMKCSHCDVSLTVHHQDMGSCDRTYGKKYQSILKCHYCGHEERMPKNCPSCGSPYIAGFGLGTQKVEEMVQKEFPNARVVRMDRDTTAGKNNMEKLLNTFAEGGADILIGTQMIVKGHDFDKVTLVGILAADLSMFSGDYASSERTFQLVTQAAGRAGRGERCGRVVIQTYQPDNYCIVSAADQDYERFYHQEIQYRQMLKYPPKMRMLRLMAEGSSDADTAKIMERLKTLGEEKQGELTGNVDGCPGGIFSNELKGESLKVKPQVEFIGPSRGVVSKARDLYRYDLYMKHPDENVLIELRECLEEAIKTWEKAGNLYFNFDIL